ITPSPYWKNQISFPDEPFRVVGGSASDPDWVKFTIILSPYDANVVYYQDCQQYIFHYHFARDLLDPFIGMSTSEYDQVTLYEQGQQAVLGAVIMPPTSGYPPPPAFPEYGIQFVRQDPYTKEEIVEMFNVVKGSIIAEPGVQAFYFPSYEQAGTAEANREWFESQGIELGSVGRWVEGNACYSEGWALGELKFFAGNQIASAYLAGELGPGDILLTDGVPAEVPFVAGIITLSASTPNSHVAILAKTYRIPFVHLALAEDANRAQELVGHQIVLRGYSTFNGIEVRLIDVEGVLDDAEIAEILTLKAPPVLDISPMAAYGAYSASTEGLLPADIKYFGGKAANFGILRSAIPNRSPVATAFSFDLWNEFPDQAIVPRESVIIEGGGYLLFWADKEEGQGPTHTNFKLDKDGEEVGLYDRDGVTLIDGLSFGQQYGDVSYGRLPDGNDNWVFFGSSTATPNQPNFGSIGGPTHGLFINEFMADNDHTIPNPHGSGYPDWIELYNAGPNAVDLGGMYLTDDMNDPTKWMIPFEISSGTLREEISNRLSGHSYRPSDMAALSADLRAIGHIIKNTSLTSFTQQQEAAVIATLQDPSYGFDAFRKIRFRSSTNVEDSNQFTGAGLYDSYSGCLADDLDGDSEGPCLCDANEDNERGVFRAIRKVFASFYNDNAYLERLRHDVNEAEVGMALLVHHSFPDEYELANGVATLEYYGGNSYTILLVTQEGAVSVANPQDSSVPEEVSVRIYSFGTYPTFVRQSNLVPLGATVMDWQDDYNDLSTLLVAAAEEFENITGKSKYILDFEYKKLSPGGAAIPGGGLVVKQVREIPRPDSTLRITPFLINEPVEFCSFQGECSDIFANHRLKSSWQFETRNIWLSKDNLGDCFYTSLGLEYLADDRVLSITGEVPLLPKAFHNFNGTNITDDGWFMHHLANPRRCELHTEYIRTEVKVDENPMLTLSDIPGFTVGVEYNEPVLSWDGSGPNTTTTDLICLRPSLKPEAGDLVQHRSFTEPKGVSISVTFYWPPDPGLAAGYTAPLSRWVETVIEGYTSETIVLHGWYSQTYRPEHHNFGEHFMFEPRLEPGVSQQILDELRAQDIRLIHLFLDEFDIGWIRTYGFEDKVFYPADIDGDEDTDFGDYAILAGRWRDIVCDECGGADLNGDGRVTGEDLGELAYNWLDGVE
ncbi:MAG: PEP/pyruvate-binding domain-containing protein, partial [Planctomycetota bacterium]